MIRRSLVVALLLFASLCATAGPARAQTPVPSPSPSPSPTYGPSLPTYGPVVPTTTATPTSPDDGGDNPGFFDVAGRVRKAINDWFYDLVSSALSPMLDLLGRSVLASPDLAGPGRTRELWGSSLAIADATFVIFVLVGGVIVMGHETVQSRYALKDIAPRLVFGFLAANMSLVIAGQGIGLANGLSRAFLGQGADPEAATAGMKRLALAPLDKGGIFIVLLGLVVAVMAVVLVGTYVLRVCALVVLVGAAPLCLIAHALPQTEGLAQLWWRGFGACLGIQIAQSLVLVTAIRVFFDTDSRAAVGLHGGNVMDLVVVGCLLYVMVRIPGWIGRMVVSGRRGGVMATVRNVAMTTYAVRTGLRVGGRR